MSARVTSAETVRLVLVAPAPNGALAAETLAQALGIPVPEATARLAEAPADLAGPMERDRAQRLATLLSLFGLRIQIDHAGRALSPPSVFFDLALQCAVPDAVDAVAAVLSPLTGLASKTVARALGQPAGLVLQGLDWSEMSHWRRTLRGVTALRIVVSDPEAAAFDLLPWGVPADPAQARALMRHLRLLGLARCEMTGAVAGGLDRAMRDHVMSRFPEAGVIALNRDFQRFDLLLVAARGLSPAELEGFLAARGGLPPVRPGARQPAMPLRIECALSRADALAFQSDYAAIGLETRVCLVWPKARRT